MLSVLTRLSQFEEFIFGAVRLRDGKLLTRQEGKVFDALTFWQFLKQLRQVSARSGRRVIVINTASGIYHYQGTRWYGKTKHGKYMSEKNAKAAGYRAAKNGQ